MSLKREQLKYIILQHLDALQIRQETNGMPECHKTFTYQESYSLSDVF